MKNVRGVRPDRRGSGKWVTAISDPFQKRQRRFHFDSQDEAVAKKLDTITKIKAVKRGALTVPPNVEDIVLWIVKDGKEGVVNGAAAISNQPATITELVASYLTRQRARIGASGDNAISPKQFQSDEYQLRLFREFCDKSKITKVANAFHPDTLEMYKAHASEHFKSKKSLSHATATVKTLIMWAWETHRIEDIPRNLKTFRKVSVPDPVAKTYTKDQFLTLIKKASPRMRVYLLLAINTGYTQQAIADLEHGMIDWDTGVIDRVRTKVQKKAEVPQKSKLWPSALEALRRFATTPSEGGLVILSEKGNPVVWQRLPEGSDSLQVVDSVQRAFNRLKKKCEIDGLSFKHIRKMGADLIKNKYTGAKTKTNAELFDMYLAHKPPKMVLHYDPGDWSELYEATDWLGRFLGLFDGGSLAKSA